MLGSGKKQYVFVALSGGQWMDMFCVRNVNIAPSLTNDMICVRNANVCTKKVIIGNKIKLSVPVSLKT